mmetsp:Transcript_9475/g.18475  ORF Transcript_9475/g.18475 Transcript_9475/m.18475 type:complete len:208 (-) Transcript_9475:3607-4230(-)
MERAGQRVPAEGQHRFVDHYQAHLDPGHRVPSEVLDSNGGRDLLAGSNVVLRCRWHHLHIKASRLARNIDSHRCGGSCRAQGQAFGCWGNRFSVVQRRTIRGLTPLSSAEPDTCCESRDPVFRHSNLELSRIGALLDLEGGQLPLYSVAIDAEHALRWRERRAHHKHGGVSMIVGLLVGDEDRILHGDLPHAELVVCHGSGVGFLRI